MKRALFWTILASFAAIVIITLFGIIGKLPIKEGYLNALFTSLILELVAAVMLLFKRTEFFAEERQATEEEKAISGGWWERLHGHPNIALSTFIVYLPAGSRSLYLEGTSFDHNGTQIAHWWSLAATLGSDNLELHYIWKGTKNLKESVGKDFLGIGWIKFSASYSGKTLTEATGWFSDGSIWDTVPPSKQSIDLIRMNEEELKVMMGKDSGKKAGLAEEVQSRWSSENHRPKADQ